jgi:hypothetical protein
MRDPEVKKRIYSSVMTAVILLVLLVAYLIFTRLTGWGIPCMFHKLTGLHCPGCGVTRMLGALLQLDFYGAFRFNMLIFCLLPFAVIFCLRHWLRWVRTGKSITDLLENTVSIIALVLAIAFGIMRNLPWFSYLSPT